MASERGLLSAQAWRLLAATSHMPQPISAVHSGNILRAATVQYSAIHSKKYLQRMVVYAIVK